MHCFSSWLQLCYFCSQACNYWTKAAAFSQCSRQCSTLIGARKSRKMSLSWSMSKKMPSLFLSWGHVGSVSEEGRGAVFASQVTEIPLWNRCSWQTNTDCGLLLCSGAKGISVHGSSSLSLSSSEVSSCVIPLFFPRKQKWQRKGFSISCPWAFSQCHPPLAGDLQKSKQS